MTMQLDATSMLRVYVYSRDVLAETGLRAQLSACESMRIEECPGLAHVAVVAWPEIDNDLTMKIQQLVEGGCSRVLLVVSNVDAATLPKILETGMCGVLRSSDASAERLVEATMAVAAGGGSLPPDLIGLLLRSTLGRGPFRLALRSSAARLADREEAVLRLLAEGYDTHQIAEELHYSERTIKGIVHSVISRFGLRNRPHAVAYALRHGLI